MESLSLSLQAWVVLKFFKNYKIASSYGFLKFSKNQQGRFYQRTGKEPVIRGRFFDRLVLWGVFLIKEPWLGVKTGVGVLITTKMALN
jgi:hypothetical protein